MSTGLESGLVISSRYRVGERIGGSGEPVAHAAVDGDTEQPVVVLVVSEAMAKALRKGKALGHAHLANVLDVTELDGKQLAVCEQLSGETLAQRLADIGSKAPVDAVRSALRVADALSSLHEAGGAHGSVHPLNVVLTPDGRDGPVLKFGPVPPDDTSYRQPEWESGDAPSEPDDTWATAALLHTMLTGKAPARVGYESESALADAGIVDPVLRVALYHALARDLDARSHDLRPLKRELARWFVEHAGEEPIAPGPHSTSPPPLPPSVRPSERAYSSSLPARRPTTAAPPPKKPSKILVLACFGAAVGLVAGWSYNHLRKPHETVIEKQRPQAEPAKKAAIDLGDVPVNGESQGTSSAGVDKVGSCVAGYMPKGTFDKPQDMGWVCDELDPRTGAEKLRVAVINGGKGSTTDAMKIFARIGWYDMAAYSVVHAGCCDSAKPLSLPAPSDKCTSMDEPLNEIGSAVVAARSYEEPLKAYTAAIHCELNAGKGPAFRHPTRPAGGEDSAFGELVHAAQP